MTHPQLASEHGSPATRRLDGLRVVAGMLAIMWVVQVINAADSQRLDSEGIVPRHLHGLIGIVCAPFLHASFGHLISNTIPFAVLGAMIAFGGGGARRLLAVTAIVALVAGLGTWLFAAGGSTTVGASGLVFGYALYLVVRGVFSRRLLELTLGALVAVLFGGALLWSLLPHAGVSWQDHLFGAIGGVIAARVLSQPGPRRARTRGAATSGAAGTRPS